MRPIRVLTWNLHGFVGQDGRFDPGRIVRILLDLDPDVVALQEVVGHDRGIDGFALLRDALPGAEAVAAFAGRPVGGVYGQLLLSRLPIRRHVEVDLSVGGREPRRAIDALLEAPGGAIRVICTHLGLAGPERRFQIGELCGLAAADPATDTLLLGDINDWRRRGIAERRLSPLLGPGTGHRTFPAAFPVLPLDRMWFRSIERSLRARVVREAGRASDHLPLAAEIRRLGPVQRRAAVSARSSQPSSVSGSSVASAGRV